MDSLMKFVEEAGNAARLVLFVTVLAVIYIIYDVLSGITRGFGEFIKSSDVAQYSRSTLIGQSNISELITSKANLDLYYFYKKNKNDQYVNTGEYLIDFAGAKVNLADNKEKKSRQYCQISLSVTFGYRFPLSNVEKVFSANADVAHLPIILGKYINKNLTAPTTPSVVSKCHSEIAGAEGDNKILAWLGQDEVLSDHMLQGVDSFSKYLSYLASDKNDADAISAWKDEANLQILQQKLELSGKIFSSSSDVEEYSKKFANIYNIAKEAALASSNNQPIIDGIAATSLQPNVTLGTYMETYSTLAYSHVNDTYLFLISDKEYAIQRDVVSVIYGVESVGRDPSIGGVMNIVATEPQIIYRNTKKSEIGLFNDTKFENFLKEFKMPVDKYMAEQVDKVREVAISNNSNSAKKSARAAFEYQIGVVAKEKGVDFEVRYLDIQPEAPSFYESVLANYLASLAK